MRVLPNLGELIDCTKDREKVAVIDRTRGGKCELTYAELLSAIATVRTHLIDDLHISPGDRVMLIGGNSVAFLATYFAVLSAGAVAVPVNPALGADIQRTILAQVSPGAVIVEADAHRPARTDIRSALFSEMLAPVTKSVPPVVVSGEDVALILFTSGSTGVPKGVVITHNSQTRSIEGIVGNSAEQYAGLSCIVAAPLFHMNALTYVHVTLAVHGRFVLLRKFDESLFMTSLAQDGVSVISGIPTMLARLSAAARAQGRGPFEQVVSVSVGSAPLSPQVLEEAEVLFPNAEIQNAYGTTEIGPGPFGEHPAGLKRPRLSIGYPAANTRIRLVGGDAKNQGVLEVYGPGLMREYLNNPEATRSRMNAGWYNTGDILRRDENGFLFFVGRNDDMFVCNGENIYPGEVEGLLEQFSGVLQSAVVPVEDHQRGHIPVAFVVVQHGGAEAANIKDFALKNGPAYRHPRHVFIVDALPLTAVNKVDRQALIRDARIRLGLA